MMKLPFNFALIIFSMFSLRSFSQENASSYDYYISQCSFDTIQNNLVEFEKLGVKEAKTRALKNTAEWLEKKYLDFGYTGIERDTFFFRKDTLFNLLICKKGTLYPESFIIVCGHYDTSHGPGVGDNGSGTCIILEIARILKDINANISVLFIHFSGEELGLVGSRHYVNQVLEKQNLKIKLVFNIDAVGGVSSKTNNTIVCECDQNDFPSSNNEESFHFTQLLAGSMEKYSSLESTINKAYASDYVPFEEKGYIITGLYEMNQSPFAHTPKDIIENVDLQYIYQVAKGALGAVLHFSGTY